MKNLSNLRCQGSRWLFRNNLHCPEFLTEFMLRNSYVWFQKHKFKPDGISMNPEIFFLNILGCRCRCMFGAELTGSLPVARAAAQADVQTRMARRPWLPNSASQSQTGLRFRPAAGLDRARARLKPLQVGQTPWQWEPASPSPRMLWCSEARYLGTGSTLRLIKTLPETRIQTRKPLNQVRSRYCQWYCDCHWYCDCQGVAGGALAAAWVTVRGHELARSERLSDGTLVDFGL